MSRAIGVKSSVRRRQLGTVFLLLMLIMPMLPSSLFIVPQISASPGTLTLRPNAEGQYHQFVEVPNGGFKWGDQFESGDFSAWTGTAGSPTIVSDPVHHGTYAAQINAGSEYFSKDLATNYDELYVCVYVRWTVLPDGIDKRVIIIRRLDNTNAIRLIYEDVSGTKRFSLETEASGTPGYYEVTLNTGQWYSLEVRYKKGTSSDAVYEFWLDEIKRISTTNGALTIQVGRIFLIADSFTNVENYYDCVVVADTYIGTENRPALVNDQSDNTGVQIASYSGETVAATARKEAYNLEDTSQTGTITSVTAYLRAKATGSDPAEQAVIGWRTYSTDYESSAFSVSRVAYTDYSQERTTNPNTGSAWTWAEVNALQIYARSSTLANGENIIFVDYWIIVTYTTGGQEFTFTLFEYANMIDINVLGREASYLGTEIASLSEISSFGIESWLFLQETGQLSDLTSYGVESLFKLTEISESFDVSIIWLERRFQPWDTILISEIMTYSKEILISSYQYIIIEQANGGMLIIVSYERPFVEPDLAVLGFILALIALALIVSSKRF